ncbi:TPA: type VI secretion system tube protein Hcp, partial [Serratia marcescens]
MPLNSTIGTEIDTVLPTDVIKLNFARIEVEYKEQNNDGSMGAVIKTGYDLKLNARI